MAFRAGHNAWLEIDGVDGSLVNISAYADQVTFPQGIDSVDVTTFSNSSKAFIPGLANGGQITFSGPLDVALGTVLGALAAAHAAGSSTTSVQYGPGGSVSGQIKQTCETYISAYDTSTGVSGRAEYSATLQITGAVTNGTW